ncbi:MAG: domain containing protein, partial [Conexibacter sp.]|nr:domain containing protein [Conexibacter sp.]
AGLGGALGAPGAIGGSGAIGGATAPFGGGAAAMVALAQGEVGQAEMPPGSNDSPRIAMYRQATPGSGVGPWCAYFASWLARSAGEPLGAQGQGFGSVDQLYAWAQGAGRAVRNGQGYVPKPGDLIVFDEHVGMVESALPNGQLQTIEGNSSDRVSRNVRGANEAIGYVRMS